MEKLLLNQNHMLILTKPSGITHIREIQVSVLCFKNRNEIILKKSRF